MTDDEAGQRLRQYGLNLVKPKRRSDAVALLLAQFKSPLIIILMFAGGSSFLLGNPADAAIILAIILVSSLLGFSQERGAANAVEKLLAIVQTEAAVLRDGNQKEIPVERIVPGDVVILNAGDLLPADCLALESKDGVVADCLYPTLEPITLERDVDVQTIIKGLTLQIRAGPPCYH